MILFGVLILVLLAVVFGLTFFRMSVQIEESIEKILPR